MTPQKKSTDQSRQQMIAAAKSELKYIPKVPVRDVQAPILMQLKFGWLVSLAFPLLAVICYVGSVYAVNTEAWRHAMLVLLTVSAILGLFLIMVSIWTLTLTSRLRDLASGNYYVLWNLTNEQANGQSESTSVSLKKIFSLTLLITLGVGMSAAGQGYAEGNLFFATVLKHFFGTALISILIGMVIGLFLWKLFGIKTDFINSRNGRVLIGPCGIYRTGSFWSFDGVFQRLYDVSISGSGNKQINLKIGTSGEHGINFEFLEIPIPQGELLNAKLLCRELEQKHSLPFI